MTPQWKYKIFLSADINLSLFLINLGKTTATIIKAQHLDRFPISEDPWKVLNNVYQVESKNRGIEILISTILLKSKKYKEEKYITKFAKESSPKEVL